MKIFIFFGALLTVTVDGKQGFGPSDQDWGYVTVRENAHMFWWLHYTAANVTKYTERPLIIWLQGGPGSGSAGKGNFQEIGPLDDSLQPRNTSWHKHANLLFVDNPVGAGFSYADTDDALTTTNAEIAADFVELMKGFYKAVPDMEKVPLYIFSESYGGKMAVDIALALNEAIKSGNLTCKLKGIGLGDSSIAPVGSALSWAPYLRSVGVVDQTGYDNIMKEAKKAKEYLDNGEYKEASIEHDMAEGKIYEAVGNIDFYNILTKMSPYAQKRGRSSENKFSETYPLADIMEKVREALNISQTWAAQRDATYYALQADLMKPVITGVEKLLNDTDIIVAVYTGELDLIDNAISAHSWMKNMYWKNKTECDKLTQEYFTVDGFIEGYNKICGNFQFYLILRAGHMAPADNTQGMFYILQTVTNDFAV